jgi:hypothetical protein
MSLAYADVRAALRTKLLTVAGLPEDRAWEAREYKPQADRPYVRETLIPGGASRQTISNPARVLTTALYQVDVMLVDDGTGTTGDAIADAIVNAFWPGLELSYNGQRVLIRTAHRGPTQDNPPHRQLPVTVFLEMRTLTPSV